MSHFGSLPYKNDTFCSWFYFQKQHSLCLNGGGGRTIFSWRNETPQTFLCMCRNFLGLIQMPHAGPAVSSWAVNCRWKSQETGACSSCQREQNSRVGIGYTNRCLSEWNLYWLTRPIDSVAPATNCRLRLPLLCATAIVGLGLHPGPLHTKFKRVEMELLHLFRSQLLHSLGCPLCHSSI